MPQKAVTHPENHPPRPETTPAPSASGLKASLGRRGEPRTRIPIAGRRRRSPTTPGCPQGNRATAATAAAPRGETRAPGSLTPPSPGTTPAAQAPHRPSSRRDETQAAGPGRGAGPRSPDSLPFPRLIPPPRPAPLTVWECRLWLASICAVSGTVSSSSTLPAGGFSMNAIAGRGGGSPGCRRQPASRWGRRRGEEAGGGVGGRRCQHGSAATPPPPGLSAARPAPPTARGRRGAGRARRGPNPGVGNGGRGMELRGEGG